MLKERVVMTGSFQICSFTRGWNETDNNSDEATPVPIPNTAVKLVRVMEGRPRKYFTASNPSPIASERPCRSVFTIDEKTGTGSGYFDVEKFGADFASFFPVREGDTPVSRMIYLPGLPGY